MSILITGATGFIGSHLIPVLELQNWQIVAAMRQPKTFSKTVEKRLLEEINGDTDWTQALKGIDIVIHLAGRAHIMQEQASDPEAEFFAVNTAGTANLVKQSIAAGVKHFIFISSIGAIATASQAAINRNYFLSARYALWTEQVASRKGCDGTYKFKFYGLDYFSSYIGVRAGKPR